MHDVRDIYIHMIKKLGFIEDCFIYKHSNEDVLCIYWVIAAFLLYISAIKSFKLVLFFLILIF